MEQEDFIAPSQRKRGSNNFFGMADLIPITVTISTMEQEDDSSNNNRNHNHHSNNHGQ